MCCTADKNADEGAAMLTHMQMHVVQCRQECKCMQASNTRARPMPGHMAVRLLVDLPLHLCHLLLHEEEFLSLPQKLTWHASTHTITTASQTYLTKPLPTSPLHFSHPSSTTSPLHFNHPTLQARHLHFTSPTLKARLNKARQTRIIQAF